MATGFLSVGVCHESLADAVDAYFSSMPVALSINAAGNTVQASYVYSAPSWYQQYSVSGSASVLTLAVPPQFVACGAPSEYFVNGTIYGAGLVGIMLFAWGFSAAAKLLK